MPDWSPSTTWSHVMENNRQWPRAHIPRDRDVIDLTEDSPDALRHHIDLTGDSVSPLKRPRKRKPDGSINLTESARMKVEAAPASSSLSSLKYNNRQNSNQDPCPNQRPSSWVHAEGQHQSRRGLGPAISGPTNSMKPESKKLYLPDPGEVWAVRVGWHPGLYNEEGARHQTHHYPGKEYKKFTTDIDGVEWILKGSEAARTDKKNRPREYLKIDKHDWTSYLARTWDPKNRRKDIPVSSMRKALRNFFVKASEDECELVDWSIHPLPQELFPPPGNPGYENEIPTEIYRGAIISTVTGLPYRFARGPCFCGVIITDLAETVECSNGSCPVAMFHKKCVGLANRKETPSWRCYPCRPKSNMLAQPNQMQQDSIPPPTAITPSYTPIVNGPAEPPLHPEQQRVVDCIVEGYNVFYTGSAGVGKSTVLKAFVEKLKKMNQRVDIIAPSGIAALNVGGMTLYSYAAWYPDMMKLPLKDIVARGYRKSPFQRLNTTDVLVIDEISMVESDLLVRLDSVMRTVRDGWRPEDGGKTSSPHSRHMPFGGVQVVVTGDFCQLPPVKPFQFCLMCGGEELKRSITDEGRPLKCNRCHNTFVDKDKWAFRNEVWDACEFKYFELRHIHRQNDVQFINILQKCRFGVPLSPDDKTLLLASKEELPGAVKLLPRRLEVETENKRNFASLKSAQIDFECLDHFLFRSPDEPELRKKGDPKYPHRPDGPLVALKDHRLEEEIHLKEGMLVILLVNLDFPAGLVNGSQGKIIGFENHSNANVFGPVNPQDKSKGKGIGGSDMMQSDLEILKQSLIQKFIDRAPITKWPVVQFQNGVVRPIYPLCQTNELGLEEPFSVLARVQIPLLAAWAITVHKSQGMTLNRVIVDLYNSFEREMVYVALSRARSLEGLKVVRLARQMDSGVNEEVQQFLEKHGLMGEN